MNTEGKETYQWIKEEGKLESYHLPNVLLWVVCVCVCVCVLFLVLIDFFVVVK